MPAHAFESIGGLPLMAATDLPKEGRDTLAQIRRGGPYPYAKDGSIFANRERALPRQPRGYYREYTVKTPGARDRGARRIICGGKQQLACYYTGDHYASFKSIRE
jgi:ribonuclease T1